MLIFSIAYKTRENKFSQSAISKNGYIYALSIGIYCTAWTFYGSVGRAYNDGVDYIAVYLGPTLLAPFWLVLVKRIIIISQNLRITSIADFISTRYGKSTSLGIMVSLAAIMSSIPYISIQLKAIDWSYHLINNKTFDHSAVMPIYTDSSLYFALALTIFAVIFGTRHLDPNEKHPGIVNAIAFESVIKLLAFLAVGVYVCWFLFDGPSEIFAMSKFDNSLSKNFTLDQNELGTWLTILIISAASSIFLPRQFHLIVIENQDEKHITKAMWIFPLYLFLISLFVIPIALGGKLLLSENFISDYYVISLPFQQGNMALVLLVFIGGLSAAASMVAIELLALSIMTSNNILLPLLLRNKFPNNFFITDISTRLLWIRRVIIFSIMLLAFGFYKGVSVKYPLVSIGLISFVGISQLIPSVMFGLFWKKASKVGALYGLLIGLIIWFYTMPFTNLVELGIVPESVLTNGPWNIGWLRPNALFNYEGMSFITHGAFWSLFANVFVFIVGSNFSKPSPIELAQADIYLNYEKYFEHKRNNYSPLSMTGKVEDIKSVFEKIFGKKEAYQFFKKYDKHSAASPELITEVEKKISGALGATSAGFLMKHLVQEKPVNVNDMIEVLNQTYQVFVASEETKQKSEELKKATAELKVANEKLVELDVLKNEFISTITHELRTPITAIRSFAGILKDYELPETKKIEYLDIISKECSRISDLVNQVLDLKKLEHDDSLKLDDIDLAELIKEVINEFENLKGKRVILFQEPDANTLLLSDEHKIRQALINILSNAIKFTPNDGIIQVFLQDNQPNCIIKINDNGYGISEKDKQHIFEKFYQIKSHHSGGTGLGLTITKKLIERMHGTIRLESTLGKGSTIIIELPDLKYFKK